MGCSKTINDPFGQELIVDMYDADSSKFDDAHIEEFVTILCEMTDMNRIKLCKTSYDQVEDYAISPWLEGDSYCQFISTSSIVIHTVTAWNKLYINFFTCKEFDPETVKDFIAEYFNGKIKNYINIVRD